VEREVISRALQEVDGHRERAAELLGISIRTLHYKLRELKLA
jgi:DNA-binding NtrC family response regulator